MVFRKTARLRSTNNCSGCSSFISSVVGLVDSTLIKLVNQGFGAGLLGAMFLMITAGNAYLTLQRGADEIIECSPS